MGVPKFFSYISERYPCILELIKEDQIPEFDNMYLDMNGILHTCSHPKDQDLTQNLSEEEIFNNIFHYVDVLFYIIRPKKLLFMAVDGVAPRAKMNQQRSRRFRVAKERELLEHKMLSEGKKLPTSRFDSNCITPGTEFMVRLQAQLEYYVASRISTNQLWQNCKVILSGHQVPGEGEHKIVEYIRYMKALPDYDPNLRHCLYGLDADLVMLGLCTHERNFSILREEVVYGRKAKCLAPEQTKFYLLHLCLLKEYLDLEFQDLKNTLPFEYDIENIIDDWVLMGFILGNDFIPHLPDFHIAKGALPDLYKAYAEVLPKLGGYLNEDGHLNLPRFQAFMEALAKHELQAFEETYSDLQYFAEKTGRKFNSEKIKDNCDKGKDGEFGKLTEGIDDLSLFDEEGVEDCFEPDGVSEDEDDEDTFLQEFCQHKRNYYLNKLDYLEVTDEVLQSQAEGYVRGLQWILHYYYHGCPSWSWYYPHHYAPCTSDVVNFKTVNLDFELGEPFLPYQQLLAVLPPASKDLLPKAYHDLMISPDSPLKDYYPRDFETDLNGKQNEWEAVVLLPIIDEGNLLNAMKECDGNLTQEETRNNKHGPMLFYSYTSENLGFYSSPKYFPDIQLNHAQVRTVWRDEITSVATKLNVKSTKKEKSDMYFPGFPTFKYVQYKTAKLKGRVRIFNYATRSDSIVLTVVEGEPVETETLALEILEKQVYVRWPFLTEARVVAVGDVDNLYTLTSDGVKRKKHSGASKFDWSANVSNWRRQYMEKNGIDIGNVKVLVYAKILKGVVFNSRKDEPRWKKVYSNNVEMYPLQTIVKDIDVFESPLCINTPEQIFSVGSVVFTLTSLYYGSMGKIVKTMGQTNDRVKVEIKVTPDHKIDLDLLNRSKPSYHTAQIAGQHIGISHIIVSKISGHILVDTSSTEQKSDKRSIVNIGLGMKFNKAQEEIPGYTKKDNYWLYSNKAIEVMKEYVKLYPNVIKCLYNRQKEPNIFQREDIFPGPNGTDEMQKLVDWISNLEISKIKRVPCGSQVIEKDVVLKLEDMIDNSPTDISYAWTIAKTYQLFKGDLITTGLPPVPNAEHRLLDRVISVRPYHPVPQGLRGYIIGISKAENSKDSIYDILYDTSFPAGMTLNCSPGRGFKTTETSFINISHGERINLSSKPRNTNRTVSATTAKSPRILVRESPSSAFAQWNINPPTPDRGNPFKGMWSMLESDEAQDETKILKKMLKIEDDQKPKIEENVKNFFESLSKNPQKFMPVVNNAVKMSSPPQSEVKSNLQHYFNIPPTKLLFNKDGKSEQREVTGFPHKDEKSMESALQVVVPCLPPPNKDAIVVNQIMESQKNLLKGRESCQNAKYLDSAKSGEKPRDTNDRYNNRNNKSLQQNQFKNNVPEVLPTPPPQWFRHYKNSYMDPDKNYHSDEQKTRSDAQRMESSRRHRFQNENQNNCDRLGSDPCNNYRNSNWRPQEDRIRSMHSEVRPGKELPFPHFNNGKRRSKFNQGESSPPWRMRSDAPHLRQENGYFDSHYSNSQVGSNNSSQKLSAVAAEFIPLQALTKTLQRKTQPSASVIRPVQSETFKREMPQEEARAPPVHLRQPSADTGKEKGWPSSRLKRKPKIAAKFDGAWDPQG